ncbi:nucleoside triphosphate pyrophosphohydrolase family protein [Hymenobacter latericus]|uniref:hypothetical protein n=1 Tax=Hymenobacter sp. YIM 151858-1 TaxID=2987688 RepID=UPI0022263B00|nr:hypothetical protein [Hymenobacter sp. YIM 151858-1]UYZ60160.1 hypothetical protein OIS50_04995 [Hymenobacter sp. YIM 151858-1]
MCKATCKNADTIDYKMEFMRAGLQPIRTEQGQPSIEERKINVRLILEELNELARDGYGIETSFKFMLFKLIADDLYVNKDGNIVCGGPGDTEQYNPVATLDALCDLRVVCDGPVLSSGLQGVFPAAMREVHVTNMNKFVNEATAQASCQYYLSAKDTPAFYDHAGDGSGNFVIKNAQTNKVLKPIGWQEPNLGQFIDGNEK